MFGILATADSGGTFGTWLQVLLELPRFPFLAWEFKAHAQAPDRTHEQNGERIFGHRTRSIGSPLPSLSTPIIPHPPAQRRKDQGRKRKVKGRRDGHGRPL